MSTTDTKRPALIDLCEAVLRKSTVTVSEFLMAEQDVLRIPLHEIESIEPELAADWRDHPDVVTEHFEAALPRWLEDPSEEHERAVKTDSTVRIVGIDDSWLYDVGNYSPSEVSGHVVHVRGQVTKRSKRRLRDDTVAFECQRCGVTNKIEQHGSDLQEPYECHGCERAGPFIEVDEGTVDRDYQNIRLQTLPEESDDGETANLDALLFDHLVGKLTPGDRVILTVEMNTVRVSENSTVKELEAKVRSFEKLDEDYTELDVEPHEEKIRTIANGDHPEYDSPFPAIIESVAPDHNGNDHIKEAISYQLFSGVEKEIPSGTTMRGNSHILLLGDPGTGKTTLIEQASRLVPRSEYTTGKNTTSAGLTATVQQNDFENGSWTLEAGTLVRAHNGLAAIDELDKMDPDDRDGMMEAMSQQRITVSMVKSGVLPAACSVLAAANPKHGRFDPMQEIDAQLNLDPVLMSRFDLWFVMQDNPDEDKDEELALSVTETARAGEKNAAGTLVEDDDYDDPPLSTEEFKAYVSLAQDCYPVLTDEAVNLTISKYVDLRQSNGDDGPVPITPRVITALHRLSEASARMRLDDEVIEADVQRAIDILLTSLEGLGIDPETGDLDATRIETGTSTSKIERSAVVKDIIEDVEDDDPAEMEEVKEVALSAGISEDNYEDAIERLEREGEVYHPRGYDSVRTT